MPSYIAAIIMPKDKFRRFQMVVRGQNPEDMQPVKSALHFEGRGAQRAPVTLVVDFEEVL
jgi:hypothetical protein